MFPCQADFAQAHHEACTLITWRSLAIDGGSAGGYTTLGALERGDVDVRKLTFTKGITQPLDQYKATPPHVAVARRLSARGEPLGVRCGHHTVSILSRLPGCPCDCPAARGSVYDNQLALDGARLPSAARQRVYSRGAPSALVVVV